ncbi:tyrosine-type recombinase/integrase [Aliarcobacter butzleri]|uniref:tyrosine-type recombinase/integrase n=1 Tax=Aliarcobacter butzleri TaxID=28197 RepID=UPI00344C977B
MLSFKEIDNLVKEFKEIKFSDIVNRNNEMTIEEIDEQIKQLKNNEYKNLIKHEMGDIQNFLISKNEDFEFGLPQDLGEKLEEYIIQIKINALNEVKKSIKLEKFTNSNFVQDEKKIKIEEAINEYYASRSSGKNLQNEKKIKTHLNMFIDFCKNEQIEYVQKLQYKDITNFKKYLVEKKPLAKVNTLNKVIVNISTFLNYCTNKAHYLNVSITKDLRFKATIKEKQESKRDPFLEEDLQNIFNNLNMFLFTKNGKKIKHYEEYQMVLKIGLYTGARLDEICQLTKDDIKKEDEIWHFDFNIEKNKTIKNIYSIRKVPIHSKIENEVLNFIENLNRNNLFNFKMNTFSKDFSLFKAKKLGFGEKKVFHSFRNTIQEYLKQKMVEIALIDEIVGHENKISKITLAYTNSYSLQNKKNALELLDFKL